MAIYTSLRFEFCQWLVQTKPLRIQQKFLLDRQSGIFGGLTIFLDNSYHSGLKRW